MLPLRRSALALALSVCIGSCKRIEEPAQNEPVRATTPSTASASSTGNTDSAAPALASPLTPTLLLTIASSAYQAALFADDEAIELLTATTAYRFLPNQAPLVRQIDLGFAATATRKNYIYWSKDALWSEPRRASNPGGTTKLSALTEQPQRIVADIATDEFAWLTRSENNQQAIVKLDGQRSKTLYTSTGPIDALTMLGDALYFVERPSSGGGWRIGRVKFAGGEPLFTGNKTGRWPALLRGEKDLIYYDGARRDVLSLSPDLQQERTLAKDFICSPMTATENVYCSTMEGVFELSTAGSKRQLVPAPRKLITNLAASSRRLAFISDDGAQGQDRLAVYAVPLSAASEAPR